MSEERERGQEKQDAAQQEENARLYDKLAERAQELFRAGKDKSAEAIESAVELARKQLTEAGIFSSERGKALKEYLLKDLARFKEFSRELGEETKSKLEPVRLGKGALASLSSLLHSTSETLQEWAKRTDQALSCRTGEVTSAGSLTCENCGKTLFLKKSGRIPPCPDCTGTHFKKGY